jgi:hypothetical protein
MNRFLLELDSHQVAVSTQFGAVCIDRRSACLLKAEAVLVAFIKE